VLYTHTFLDPAS